MNGSVHQRGVSCKMADPSNHERQRNPNNGLGNSPKMSFDNILHQCIDGINYYCTKDIQDMKKSVAAVRQLKLRDDDVLMVGYPKSGNHWIFEVLSMVLHQTSEFDDRYFWERAIEFLSEEYETLQKKLDIFDSPRNLNTHLRPHRFPKDVSDRKVKIVYLIRNPKDIAVSLYAMFSSFRLQEMRYYGSFDDFFDLYLKGEFFQGYWFDHVLHMEKFMNDHLDHPVFVLSFERMKEEPVKVIKELCAFLGKPDDLAEEIARVTAFDNMKAVLEAGKMEQQKLYMMQEGKPGIIRKGVIGDWKNWLTVQQSEDLDKLFEEKMAGSKLGELVRKYMAQK